MSMTRNATIYGGMSVPSHHRLRPPSKMMVKILSLIMAVVFLAATAIVSLSSTANAFSLDDFSCGTDLGVHTQFTERNGQDVLGNNNDNAANKKATKYTMMDLFAQTIHWTTYNGSHSPDSIGADGSSFDGIEKGSGRGAKDAADGLKARQANVKELSKSSHSWNKCIGNTVSTWVSGAILALASLAASFISFFVGAAVDPSLICQDPTNPTGACVNLIGIIGGTTGAEGEGIIGRLYTGLYQGLVGIVIVWAALWTLLKLMKMQLSTVVQSIAWTILMAVVGIACLVNPMLIAKAPMRLGTSLASCAVEGMSGINCMSDDKTPEPDHDNTGSECAVDLDTDLDVSSQLKLLTKESSCKIWKAFVLEPWAAGEFGVSYEDLYTGGNNSTQGAFFAALDQNNVKYWKDIDQSLYSAAGDASDLCSDKSSSYRYSNMGLYTLALQTNYFDCQGAKTTAYHDKRKVLSNDQTYADWYYVVDALGQAKQTSSSTDKAKDISASWSWFQGSRFVDRIQLALTAMITAIMACIALIPAAIWGLVYMFIGVLLMAFAPPFLLIGIVPGPGKKIFLGWLQQVITAIMKYFVSILWVLVGVELYGAVLGSVTNISISFLFGIVVTMVIKMYRKEFVNMLGKINLGGQEMSNKIGERLSSVGKQVSTYGKARAGGAVGGFISGGEDGSFKSRLKASHDTSKWSGTQVLKRGRGIMASSARSKDAVQDRRRNKARSMAEDTKRNLSKQNEELSKSTKLVDDASIDAADVTTITTAASTKFAADTAIPNKVAGTDGNSRGIEMLIRGQQQEERALANQILTGKDRSGKSLTDSSGMIHLKGSNGHNYQYAGTSADVTVRATDATGYTQYNDAAKVLRRDGASAAEIATAQHVMSINKVAHDAVKASIDEGAEQWGKTHDSDAVKHTNMADENFTSFAAMKTEYQEAESIKDTAKDERDKEMFRAEQIEAQKKNKEYRDIVTRNSSDLNSRALAGNVSGRKITQLEANNRASKVANDGQGHFDMDQWRAHYSAGDTDIQQVRTGWLK